MVLGNPPIIFYQPFSTLDLVYILWAQLLLDYYTDHLETMHTCSIWS